ncbi:MAG: TIGR04372 family glycosyltransferase [Deltaproteobacteria bacterium]
MSKDISSEVRKYILQAEALYDSGKFTESLNLAKKAVAADPDNAYALNLLGATYYQLGDMMKAVFYTHRACGLYFSNKQYNSMVAMNYIASLIGVGDLRTAVELLESWQSTGDPAVTNTLNKVCAMQQDKITAGLNDIFQLIKPTKVIFGVMHSYRLGHACVNTELLLRLIQLGRLNKEDKYILIGSENPANKQIIDMYKRHISIIENSELSSFLRKYVGAFSTSEHWIDTLPLLVGNEYEEFNATNKTIGFTEEEEIKGTLELEKMGITDNDWFVCIFARDSEYLKVHTPGADWTYHDYRDMDVNTYSKAIDFIIDKGGYVVRMGHIVNQKLNYSHKKMVHYGGSDMRTDFMDVYLSAKCRFYIGSPSGACEIAASSFEVPLLLVNAAPVGYKPITKKALYIPQKIKKTGGYNYVSFSKLFNKFTRIDDPSLIDGNKFKKMGYVYNKNTTDEILDATIEMYERVTSKYRPDADDQVLLNSYFELYPKTHFNRKNKTPISISFLKRHRNLYFE